MLSDFVKVIAEMAVYASSPKAFQLPGEPEHVYYVLNHKSGEILTFEAEPEPRCHRVFSLDAVAQAVDLSGEKPCSVWLSRHGVTVLLDDSTRRDTVSFELALSEPCKMLLEMESKPARRKQAELIWWLRTAWARYLADPGAVNALRNLRWSYLKETTEETVKGKASLGKSIEAKVSGANAIPETLTVLFPVFATDRANSGMVRIVLDTDPANEQFVLAVESGSVESCIASAEQNMKEHLESALADRENVKVFFGKP